VKEFIYLNLITPIAYGDQKHYIIEYIIHSNVIFLFCMNIPPIHLVYDYLFVLVKFMVNILANEATQINNLNRGCV